MNRKCQNCPLMASEKRYYANDQMAEMVEGNYRILLILSRFGIGMGFCEKSIGEVCADAGVDVGTFLAIVNIALESPPCEVCDTLDPAEARDEGVGVDTEILIRYLCEGHRYFLSLRLPAIRNELMSVWNEPQSDLYRVMMRYFDDFAASVASHARYEEQTIFPYFRALVDGQRPQPLERSGRTLRDSRPSARNAPTAGQLLHRGKRGWGVRPAGPNLYLRMGVGRPRQSGGAVGRVDDRANGDAIEYGRSMTQRRFHIVIAEPSDIVRRGIRSIMEGLSGCLWGGGLTISEITDARQLRSLVTDRRPDMIVINPSMGANLPPQIRCVMLRTHLVEAARESMFDEVISLYDPVAAIREKLERIVAQTLGQSPRRHESLSKREKEIVACLVKGMTNRQIAEGLHLSPHTVGTHRRNIQQKLDIHSMSGLMVYAISNKLVKLDELDAVGV